MSETAGNQKTSSASGYFVLSYCLLVPFAGPIVLFAVINSTHNDALVFGGATAVYLSSVALGLFNVRGFKKYGRAEFRALIVGIVLSGIGALLSAGVCLISFIGLPYIC